MVSWTRGDETATHRLCVTVVGASAGPGWTTTCTETARSTTPPCHHVTMSPPSHSVLYTGASPCVQPPPVTHKGQEGLLLNSILISFVKRRCHGVMVAWARGMKPPHTGCV